MSAPDDRSGVSGEEAGQPSAAAPADAAPAQTADALPDDDAARAEADAAAAAAVDLGLDGARSTRAATCPYLRAAGPGGALGRPEDIATDGQLCIAMGEPAVLSVRQQALVCLTDAHTDCPRYMRAMLVIPVTEPARPTAPRLHPATLVATILLAISAVVAIVFVAGNGGLALPVASVEPSAAASEIAAVSPSASPRPSQAPSPSAVPSPSADASAVASATPEPSPTPAPPSSPATPRPSSDRYELLEPCPDRPDCYVYTVRAGDNLFSIARYFGVPIDTIYDLNPWLRGTGLRAGQELVLPPPTR